MDVRKAMNNIGDITVFLHNEKLADPNVKNNKGNTHLDLSDYGQFLDIVQCSIGKKC